MKELKKQILDIWNHLKPLQKLCILGLALSLCFVFYYILFKSGGTSYVSLYPKGRLTSTDIEEVRACLDEKQVQYEENEEGQIFVLREKASKLRALLAQMGVPKKAGGKGFELFDSNTWIKGDSELQVMQMRALKGQLEKDLAAFENIKSANVILDLPSQRVFGMEGEKAKASVILNLMPGAHLSLSELWAITYHLTGAVRGLQPNMIAISDTKGRLYQIIDPEADYEKIKEALSNQIVHSLPQALAASENLSEKKDEWKALDPASSLLFYLAIFSVFLIACSGAALFFKLHRRNKPQKHVKSPREIDFTEERVSMETLLGKLNKKTLYSLLSEEDPETLALFFADLEKGRAEEIIASLPLDLQHRILRALAEIKL